MGRKTYRDDDLCYTVSSGESSDTVGAFLLAQGLPKASTKPLFAEGLIRLNDYKCQAKAAIEAGDTIRLQFPKEKVDAEALHLDFPILYEDHDLLIIDKPEGLTVNSKEQLSVANIVASYFKEQGIKRKIRFLNRLDRDTTGCLVIAKSALAQAFYQQQFDDGRFEKWYEAIVEGCLEGADTLRLPMDKGDDGIRRVVKNGGKMTETCYEALSYVDNQTTVRLGLKTGKTHQIRVAMAHIGHPLVGDSLYGHGGENETYKLRATQLSFYHMRSGEKIIISAAK